MTHAGRHPAIKRRPGTEEWREFAVGQPNMRAGKLRGTGGLESADGHGEHLEFARHAYQIRRQREAIFGPELFADPAWDLLLDLFIAGEESRKVSVKSACLAASVPPTTALRYIAHLVDVGLVSRRRHPTDSRSTHVELTEAGRAKMTGYLSRALVILGGPVS